MLQPSPPPPQREANSYQPVIQLHYENEPLVVRPDGIPPQQIEWFPRYKTEWNTNQKILHILYAANVDFNSQCISSSSTILPRPCSGHHLIYPRLDNSWFKNDSYIWRKRRDGRNTREDHMKLKVNGQQSIDAKYVHSAIVPTFHRRIYFRPDCTHVLVHYLNESPNVTEETAEEIARTMKANNVLISLEQLSEQLDCIYVFMNNREGLQRLVHNVNEHLIKKGIFLPESRVSQEPITPTSREMQLERRNSCSSAFRKSLSSVALRRQPSANSEIDANHIGTMLKRYGCNGSSNDKLTIVPSIVSSYSPIRNRAGMESRSPSGDAGNTFEEDSMYQQFSVKSSTNGSTPASAFAEKMKIRSGSQESPMGPPATPPSSVASASLTQIIEMTPSSSSMKGGQKMLVVGMYYRKGQDYKISFGRGRMMPASLIHAGVLSCVIPPSVKPEVVQVRVFCNGLPVSTAVDFTYESLSENEQKEDDDKLVQIFEKIRTMACAFNVSSAVENIQSSSCMESNLTNLVQQIEHEVSNGSPEFFRAEMFHLLNGSSQFPSKTILHLVASFDYDRLFEALLDLSKKVPKCRELDIFARDLDGSTPLHSACKHNAARTARMIVNIDPSAIDVMNDKGKTPADMAPEHAIDILSDKNNEEERVNATELWVMTNGKAFTSENLLSDKISRTPIAEKDDLMREATSSYSVMSEMYGAQIPGTSRECDEDCDSCYERAGQLHVEISMDTDVHVPDSPKMARLFEAVTSPGIVITPNARARMADLARQIIDALPDRIKRNSEVSTFQDEDETNQFRGMDQMLFEASCSMSVDSPNIFTDDYLETMTTARGDKFADPRSNETADTSGTGRSAQLFATNCNFFDDRSFASSSTRANTFESDTLDFDKDLGEFFTIHMDSCVDPIQQRLANLKYNDDEQRDVYEAAILIQRAYREYRARNTTRRQEEVERRAALKIQGCYRRYKQFCYFKKLHNAAIVVQKHFRMRKRDDKEEGAVEAVIASVPEHPTLDGQSICIQVPKTNSTLLRERAATTIQVAYRYRHRKRQAAARKIQNFMRQNRNKLRKMHAQNEDGTSPARKPLETNATNETQMESEKEMMTSFRVPPQMLTDLSLPRAIINGTN